MEFVNLEGYSSIRPQDAAVDFTHIYDFVEDILPRQRKTKYRPNSAVQNGINTTHFRYTISSQNSGRSKSEHSILLAPGISSQRADPTLLNNAGYLFQETVFVDGAHIKANVNTKKLVKKAIPQAAKIYSDQLMDKITQDGEDHEKMPFDKQKYPGKKIVNESTTDLESGVFHKGEHKKCLAYSAMTTYDKNSYIM